MQNALKSEYDHNEAKREVSFSKMQLLKKLKFLMLRKPNRNSHRKKRFYQFIFGNCQCRTFLNLFWVVENTRYKNTPGKNHTFQQVRICNNKDLSLNQLTHQVCRIESLGCIS